MYTFLLNSVFLLCLLFSQPASSTCTSDLCGTGSSFSTVFYQTTFLGFFSSYFSSENSKGTILSLDYAPLGSGAGRRATYNNNTGKNFSDYTFSASDVPLSAKELIRTLPNTVRTYPILVGTLAIQINKPALFAIQTKFGEHFTLKKDVLVDIFLGVITRWNDPRILATQPPNITAALLNDNSTINVLVRNENSGSTNILTTYFSKISPVWNTTYGVLDTFPKNLSYTTRFDGDVMVSAVEVTVDSIAYMPGASVNSVVASQTVSIENAVGEFTRPNLASLQAAVQGIDLDSNFIASNTIDLNFSGAYPLVSPSYMLIIQNNNYSYFNCTQRRLLMLYISFILNSAIINETNKPINFITISEKYRTLIMADLETYVCGPDDVKSYIVETPKPSTYIDLWAATGVIGGIAFFVLIIAFIFYLIKEIKGWIFRLYSIVLVFSILFTLLTLIPWVMIPTNSDICLARVWMVFFSVYMLLAATASRTDILRATYKAMKKNDISKLSNLQKKFRSGKSIFYLVLRLQIVVVLAQFIILIIWTFVSPYVSTIVLTDPTLRIGEYRCVTNTFGYFIVEAILYTILLMLGLYNLYSSWSLSSRTSQTKWLLISLYNFMVAGVIVIPLLYFVADNKSTSAVISSLLIFLAVQAIFCFFVPGVIEASDSGMKRLRRISQTSRSTKTSGSQSRKADSQSRKNETAEAETTS